MPKKVIIIGGGIAGLSTAYLLKKEGIKSIVLEQADRLGGRIFTKEIDGLRFELGATWVFEDPYLKRLIQELGLELYPQYLKGDGLIKYSPEMLTQKSSTEVLMNGAVYHKVKGGTGEIIHALAKELESSCVHLNARVTALDFENIAVKVSLADGSALEADRVILALPPKSIAENIGITPIFDRDGLLKTTQTWMGESAKFTAFFDRDYWREQKLSGFVYSNFGLIREMQDHQSPDGKSFGLVGFVKAVGELGSDFDKRKRAFLTEIEDLFGDSGRNGCLGYECTF